MFLLVIERGVKMVEVSWNEFYTLIVPLALFVLGMTVYAIFIFKFYRFLARKDIFEIDLEKYSDVKFGGLKKFFRVVFYIIQHLLLFPLFVFLWFAMISVLLMVLAKGQTAGSILLISMALVATIRVAAYYNEALSVDLAKMLPLALLGVFLIDISFFSFDASLELIKQIPALSKTVGYYLVFIIALELVLRIISSVLPKKEAK